MAEKTADTKKKLKLRIITPEKIKVDEAVDMVIMRCNTGEMGILPGHETRSAVLDYGALRILVDESERRIAVFGGIVEIRDDAVTVLTGAAEWPEDIDRTRAEAEREYAERRLRESADALGIKRDQVALRRALVQIEVSSYPLISKPTEKRT